MTVIKRFILDTSALLQSPEILARVGQRKLVIPEAVLKELSGRGRLETRTAIIKLIQDATARGVQVVPSPEQHINEFQVTGSGSPRLAGADIDIARIAFNYAERFGNDAVVVVTLDRALQKILSESGIKSITVSQFLYDSTDVAPDQEIEQSVKSFVSKQWIFTAFSAVLGLAASLLGNFAYSKFAYLVVTFTVWGTLIALPIIGIALYWYRQKYRLSYGIFEFIVGVMMTYYVFFPTFNYTGMTVTEGIQVIGGLYVMVRGLDNVSKGIEGTKAEEIWKKFFS